MNRDKLYYENRIKLLSSRNKDNGRIIKKLERQLKTQENNCITIREHKTH